MKKNNQKIEQFRIKHPFSGWGEGNNGAFIIPFEGFKLQVIASDGDGWDHVSVSLQTRIPSWKQMCFVKDLFFEEEEIAIQLHPPKSKYINVHNNCLHLWRKQGVRIELPPLVMV